MFERVKENKERKEGRRTMGREGVGGASSAVGEGEGEGPMVVVH